MFADGHAKLHRIIVHGAVDSDVCYMYEDNNDGGSDAVSMATRSNMLRQRPLRGKENIARSIECQIRRESKVATEASSMIVLYTVYRSVFTNFIFICHPSPICFFRGLTTHTASPLITNPILCGSCVRVESNHPRYHRHNSIISPRRKYKTLPLTPLFILFFFS
jgi:hypothetical protein